MASKLMSHLLPPVSERFEKSWVSTCGTLGFELSTIDERWRGFVVTLFGLSSLGVFSRRTTPPDFAYKRVSWPNGGSSRQRTSTHM